MVDEFYNMIEYSIKSLIVLVLLSSQFYLFQIRNLEKYKFSHFIFSMIDWHLFFYVAFV